MNRTTKALLLARDGERGGERGRQDNVRSEGGEMNYRGNGRMNYGGREQGGEMAYPEMNYPRMNEGGEMRYGQGEASYGRREGERMHPARSEGRPGMQYRDGEREADAARYGYGGGDDDDEVDSRFRDRRGREHYDNGRFAPMRSEGQPQGGYPYMPVPPIWRGVRQEATGMPRITGFGLTSHYGAEHREGGMERGTGYEMQPEPLTEQKAKEWMQGFQNEDGSKGPHWPLEQAKQVMAQKGIPGNPVEFWVALNMMYSDYCGVAKKLGVNNTDFYIELAKAFLNDKDAGEGKLERYLEFVVK